MRAGHEDQGLRRRNFLRASHELAKQMREWRRTAPQMTLPLSPYTTKATPPMGELDDAEIEDFAQEISRRDAERSIQQSNESLARAKKKTGEAA